MLKEREIKSILKQKEQEQRALEFIKIPRARKIRADLRLSIEIELLKKLLGGTNE